MSSTGRWVLAGLSGLAFLVFAYLQASDLVANEGADAPVTNASLQSAMQVLGGLGIVIALNVAAIPGGGERRRPEMQEWAKPKDG